MLVVALMCADECFFRKKCKLAWHAWLHSFCSCHTTSATSCQAIRMKFATLVLWSELTYLNFQRFLILAASLELQARKKNITQIGGWFRYLHNKSEHTLPIYWCSSTTISSVFLKLGPRCCRYRVLKNISARDFTLSRNTATHHRAFHVAFEINPQFTYTFNEIL